MRKTISAIHFLVHSYVARRTALIVFIRNSCSKLRSIIQSIITRFVTTAHVPRYSATRPVTQGTIFCMHTFTRDITRDSSALVCSAATHGAPDVLCKQYRISILFFFFFCSLPLFQRWWGATWCFHLFPSRSRTIACCTVNFFASIFNYIVFLGFLSHWYNSLMLLLPAVRFPFLIHARTNSVFAGSAILSTSVVSLHRIPRTVSFLILSRLVTLNRLNKG